MNIQGVIFHQVVAHSTINSDIFCEFLVRLLEKLEENNIDEAWLVMDNASLYKTEKVRSLVDQSRHTLIFLLPYSPKKCFPK